MVDYNEILLQAVDTVVQARLNDLAFDRTIKCSVADIIDASKGHYTVTDGTVGLDAYCDPSIKYAIGERVYVTIPQGDFSQKKIIAGRITEETNDPIKYVSPLETIINVTQNLANGLGSKDINITNDNKSSIVLLKSINLYSEDSIIAPEETVIYDTIGFSADLYTDFTDVHTGNYGIRIDTFETIEEEGVVQNTMFSTYFDSTQMFGNPHLFTVPLQQVLKIDKGNKLVWGFNIYLYQNGNFDNDSGTITISDVNLFIGSEAGKIADDTFEIYTRTGATYTNKDKHKNIYIKWVNKDVETNKFIGFSDGIVDTNYDEIVYQEEYEANFQGIQLELPEPPSEGVDATNDDTIYRGDIYEVKESLQMYATADTLTISMQKIFDIIDINAKAIVDSFDTQAAIYTPDDKPECIADLQSVIDEFVSSVKPTRYEKDIIDYLKQTKSLEDVDSVNPLKLTDSNFNDCLNRVKEQLNKCKYSQSDVLKAYVVTNPGIKLYLEQLESRVNSLEASIDDEKELLNTAIAKQENVSVKLVEHLQSGEIKTAADEYAEFQDENANRYCIYWYRYNENTKDSGDKYYPNYWDRVDGIKYPEIKDGSYKSLISNAYAAPVNGEIHEEKYKAVMFFNHKRFESDIILVNKTSTTADEGNKIHGDLSIEVGGAVDATANSMDHHQLYNSYYTLVKASDQFINRKIRLRFDGIEGKDEVLANSVVLWYVPISNTMLKYDKVKLETEGFSYLDPNKAENADYYNAQYIKEGYACFQKEITGSLDEEDNIIVTIEDTYFWYQVKPVYSPTAANNTIICKVLKDGFEYETSKSFTFGTWGSNGTDYTLSIVPIEGNGIVNGSTETKFKCVLTDPNGVATDVDEVVWHWGSNSSVAKEYTVNKAGILSAEYNIKIEQTEKTITLTTFYPVAQASGEYYLDGPAIIIYNDQGVQPQYYNAEYTLYTSAGELLEGSCSINNDNTFGITLDGTKLVVSPIYYTSTNCIYPIITFTSGNITFNQPIYVGQNRYGNPMLNSWDEKLLIDKDSDTILAAMVGAGYKDTENGFHGVLMGKVSSGNNTEIGLFGYNSGAQSFGFKEDGTAFIGKAGHGRILFDGNESTIKSASWDSGYGTYLDLDDAALQLITEDKKNKFSFNKDGLEVSLSTKDMSSHFTFNNSGLEMKVPAAKIIIAGNQNTADKTLVEWGDGIIKSAVSNAENYTDSQIDQQADRITAQVKKDIPITKVMYSHRTGVAATYESFYLGPWKSYSEELGQYVSSGANAPLTDTHKSPFKDGDTIQIQFFNERSRSDLPARLWWYVYTDQSERLGFNIECDASFMWKANDIVTLIYKENVIVDASNENPSSKTYFMPISISSSELSMLSDMISARVTDESTNHSFGWNLTSTNFKLISNNEPVLTCSDKGLEIGGQGLITSKNFAENDSEGITDGMQISLSNGEIRTAGLLITNNSDALALSKGSMSVTVADKIVLQADADRVSMATTNYIYAPGEAPAYYCCKAITTRPTNGSVGIRATPGGTKIGSYDYPNGQVVFFKTKQNAACTNSENNIGTAYSKNNLDTSTPGWLPIFVKLSGSKYIPYTKQSDLPTDNPPMVGYVWYEGAADDPLFKAPTSIEIKGVSSTVSGSKINFSAAQTIENYISIGGPQINQYIRIGGDDTYALQIGTFRVKWDGSTT